MEALSIPEPMSGCTLWIGALANGYGQVRIGPKLFQAHRVAYELVKGPIPDGLVVDHLCRNTACVNPRHLEPVTNGENLRRGHWSHSDLPIAKFFSCGHEVSPDNTYKYNGQRACKRCSKAAMRRLYVRRVARAKGMEATR